MQYKILYKTIDSDENNGLCTEGMENFCQSISSITEKYFGEMSPYEKPEQTINNKKIGMSRLHNNTVEILVTKSKKQKSSIFPIFAFIDDAEAEFKYKMEIRIRFLSNAVREMQKYEFKGEINWRIGEEKKDFDCKIKTNISPHIYHMPAP